MLGPTPLKGAGATAPNIVYSRWVEAFKKADNTVDLSYEATGSGDGIAKLEAGTVDFAATDIPLTDMELQKFKVKMLHFPTLTGAIVPVYNLAVKKQLQFSADTLAGILTGKIKTWNDPALAKENAGVALPKDAIVVVHRSDASGSTYALTDFLTQASPLWKDIGKGATVNWPVGDGASGNEGVAVKVKATPNSFGYVEFNYVGRNKLTYGLVKNAKGEYAQPDLPSQNAAVRSKPELENDSRLSVANSSAKGAYPITTLTWLLVPSEYAESSKANAMRRFLSWIYRAGMDVALPLDYGLLPAEIIDPVKKHINDIKSK
jgi:phosphate transport system substrate-binding protein